MLLPRLKKIFGTLKNARRQSGFLKQTLHRPSHRFIVIHYCDEYLLMLIRHNATITQRTESDNYPFV